MSPDSPVDDQPDGSPRFLCTWSQEGLDAASVRVSGRLNAARAPLLDLTLRAAVQHGRLVLLNLYAVPSVDGAALRVMIDASVRARETGRRVLVVASPQTAPLFAAAADAGTVELLATHPALAPDPTALSSDVDQRVRPLDNPVNARVLAGRVMTLPARGLWLHDAQGALHRAWAPPRTHVAALRGKPLEVYLDGHDALNGWRDPQSGLAINQRRLDVAQAPAADSAVLCQGPCGVLWQAPAPAALIEHDERCLTCAGPLVLS